MKILGITPKNPYGFETPEESQLKRLAKLGHEVILYEEGMIIPKDLDVVAAMSEVSCEKAFNISQAYNLPFFAHMEWLPEWRIFRESEDKWGMEDEPLPYYQKMNFVRMYERYTFCWSVANVKTLSAKCFNSTMLEFMGRHVPIDTKYLSVDMEKINEYLKGNRPQKHTDEVTCVARHVPHKRIHHIIKALNSIKFKGTLNLSIYDGKYADYSKYKPTFDIRYFDSSRALEMMDRSKVTIALWSGMVPAEAMLVGTPAITYDSPYMKELYDDTIEYVDNNDIGLLGIRIQNALARDSSSDTKICEFFKTKMNNGTLNTLTQEQAVKLLESLLKKTIALHR